MATTFTERWDGTSWRVVASPNPAAGLDELNGMVAVAADDVLAVGRDTAGTLIEHWDGKTWTAQAGANPGSSFNSLVGVTAVGGARWAVGSTASGSNRHTLIERSLGWGAAGATNCAHSGA
jgi:hypothetical protein